MLSASLDCLNSRGFDDALALLDDAQSSLRDASPGGDLTPRQTLYFCLARGGVFQAAGKYETGLEAYADGESILELLDPLDAYIPLWHSCMGYMLYHLGVWQMAYDQMVRAAVQRREHPEYGKTHSDTASAYHNLGCLLYRLGFDLKAREVVRRAAEGLTAAAGSGHPRTSVAARNLDMIRAGMAAASRAGSLPLGTLRTPALSLAARPASAPAREGRYGAPVPGPIPVHSADIAAALPKPLLRAGGDMMERLAAVQLRMQARAKAAESLAAKSSAPAKGKGARGDAAAPPPAPPPAKAAPGGKKGAAAPPPPPPPAHPQAPDHWHYMWGQRATLGAGMKCAPVEIQLMYKNVLKELQEPGDAAQLAPPPPPPAERPPTPGKKGAKGAKAGSKAGSGNKATGAASAAAADASTAVPASDASPAAAPAAPAPAGAGAAGPRASVSFAPDTADAQRAEAARPASALAAGRRPVAARPTVSNLKAILAQAGLDNAAATVHEASSAAAAAPLFRSGRIQDPLVGGGADQLLAASKYGQRRAGIASMGGSFAQFGGGQGSAGSGSSGRAGRGAPSPARRGAADGSPALVRVALALSKIKSSSWLAKAQEDDAVRKMEALLG